MKNIQEVSDHCRIFLNNDERQKAKREHERLSEDKKKQLHCKSCWLLIEIESNKIICMFNAM